MKLDTHLTAILAGTAVTSALVITLPQAALALTGVEINNIAREVTVLIASENSIGSGVIIARSGNTYYALTNHHVIAQPTNYIVRTADGQSHAVEYSRIQTLTPGLENINEPDLAVVEFSSANTYQVATLGTATVSEGQEVFVSGWPAPGTVGTAGDDPQLIRQFTNGRISGLLDRPISGYQISYTNVTRGGMSGGPVLDTEGRVVAVHGLGDTESPEQLAMSTGMPIEIAAEISGRIKLGFNYGIPISTFLQEAPQAGIYLSLNVDNSPAAELGETYVASPQTDSRDVITDVNEFLFTVDNTIDTIDRGANTLCRFIGC